MNYYFAPLISGLETCVTLVNFPPIGGFGSATMDLYAFAAWPAESVWHVQELGELKRGESEVYRHADIPGDFSGEGIVIFFLYPERLPQTLEKLPVRSIMNTVPAWRGNIQFRSKTTAVSFQGEYPDAMLRIPKGSLTTIGPMVQLENGVSTLLILVNLRERAEIEPRTLVLGHLRSKKKVDERKVMTNTCNIVSLQDIPSTPDDPICAFSPDMVAVPIYLSHDTGYRHMSLEHTHPPIEFTVFGEQEERQSVVANMKKFWLGHMCPGTGQLFV